jgi:hypothetical protein
VSKGNNHLKLEDMKDLVKTWESLIIGRGSIGLYFTQKTLRPLKKLGITPEMPIKDAYSILSNLQSLKNSKI